MSFVFREKTHLQMFPMFPRASTRAENGAANALREEFLTGPIWESTEEKMKVGWYDCIEKLGPSEWSEAIVEPRGGTKSHIDFKFVYFDSLGNVKKSIRIEYKYNAKSIKNLPQIMDICSRNSGFTENKYIRHYYDSNPIFHSLPFEEYERLAFSYRKNEETSKGSGDLGIKEFLEANWKTFDVHKFMSRMHKSQMGKIFILHSGLDEFQIETLNITYDDTVKVKYDGNHTLFVGQFRVSLRWKNGNGIRNPAWSIGLRK